MQAAHERRSNVAVRVPLDVLVSLAHRDFDEPFEADAVNLSTGGLSMRAAYLPEVGSRLACRFECPPLGEPLEAEGEVVWATDAGEHQGEFGLRFVALDARSEEAIRALVGDDAEASAVPAPGARAVARLFLDGVPTPIVARVTHRADDLMTLEQELPFLALDTGVAVRDASGAARRGRIGSGDLQLCGDLPKLVLQVVFDEPLAASAASTSVASPSSMATSSRPLTLPGDDRTDPDLVAPMMAHAAYADDEAEHAAVRRSSSGMLAAPTGGEEDDEEEHEDSARLSADDALRELNASMAASATAASATTVGAAPTRPVRDAVQVVRNDRDGTPALGSEVPAQKLALVLAKLLSLVSRTRSEAVALWERVKPVLLAALERARAVSVAAVRRVGPAVQAASARTIALLSRFAGVLRAKVDARAAATSAQAQKPRRTTAPAPTVAAPGEWRSRKTAAAAPEAVVVRRPVGRYVVLAAAAVGAVALGAYAFSGDDGDKLEIPGAPVTPLAPASPATAVTVPAPVPALAAPTEVPAALPTLPTAAMPAAVVPATPTALSAPSYVAGHLPPPTYPTVQAAARPAAPPAGLATASPYAVDVRGEAIAGRDPTLRAPAANGVGAAPAAADPNAASASAQEFGQPNVSHGQTFTLRMSQNVTGLVGRPDPSGFDVRILGALTLDRAAPIATSHPAVATAMIINRGDHADLAIRFRDGMAPAYHVAVRGASVEITIARR